MDGGEALAAACRRLRANDPTLRELAQDVPRPMRPSAGRGGPGRDAHIRRLTARLSSAAHDIGADGVRMVAESLRGNTALRSLKCVTWGAFVLQVPLALMTFYRCTHISCHPLRGVSVPSDALMCSLSLSATAGNKGARALADVLSGNHTLGALT